MLGICPIRYGWQTPPTQSPPRHECPQTPQFSLSVLKSGSRRCTCRPGTCRSACTRCRRCRTCRPPRSAVEHDARARVARARRVTGPGAGQVTGLLPVQTSALAACRSACRRCRRCTTIRWPRSSAPSTAPSTDCRSPPTLHVAAAGQVTGLIRCRRRPGSVSVCVQALPSLHDDPLAAFVCVEHCPVDGLHVPATLHVAAAGQSTGLEPTHAPAWQLSVCVQRVAVVAARPVGGVCRRRAYPRRGIAGPRHLAGRRGARHRGARRARPALAGVAHRAAVAVAAARPVRDGRARPGAARAPPGRRPSRASAAPAAARCGPARPRAGRPAPCFHRRSRAVCAETLLLALPSRAARAHRRTPCPRSATCRSRRTSAAEGRCTAWRSRVHAAQVPALQTFAQAAPVFCQTPFASHICGCRFMHCLALGVQLPVQVPLMQT